MHVLVRALYCASILAPTIYAIEIFVLLVVCDIVYPGVYVRIAFECVHITCIIHGSPHILFLDGHCLLLG